MATSAAAMLLDELMGRDRNLAPTEKRRETRWDDPETCKYFLCAFCPHELFVNTRADLGPCDKIHDDELRKGYQRSGRFERMGYEEEFMRFLQSLLADVERRIKRGHARLALNTNQQQQAGGPAANKEDQIEFLTTRINDLVEEAEELGCQGKVEEAQGVMRLCDQLREERTNLETADKKGKSREEEMAKKMEVCNVCGALLVAGDAQQRIDEHIMGKQHMGYARIRVYIEQRQAGIRAAEMGEEEKLEQERVERERLREEEKQKREKEKELEREQEKEKERERERERRRRSRSSSRSRRRRSRSRSKGRRRSRDRDRVRRDRSHERRRRSRSRDRSRDRDRDRRRSRSRSRHSSHSKSSSRRSSRDRDKERERDRHRHRSRSQSKGHRSRSRSRDRRDKDKKSHSREKDHEERRGSRERSQENGMAKNEMEPHLDAAESHHSRGEDAGAAYPPDDRDLGISASDHYPSTHPMPSASHTEGDSN